MTAKAPILVAIFLMSALGGTVVSAASGDRQITTNEPVRPQRVFCRREAVTGSHFKRRVCRTESQLRQDKADAVRELEQMQAYRDAEIRRQDFNQAR